ncbi:conserved hypothetical protein [Neospora caninum Liverpool]|uniref:Uncharacterized protein n=1 Tax=Neospora caninum (strain Liverpool) TaxID=572307 RepID=F0V9W6_NEOCL|nr:conserved hypothetical protein [Neospora caninum Liverpool]CBZ50728.1 conserved hypothetical protein [Neospora caninum Liverpool]CEL65340.1 TPA: hypothetical protein BN1204_011950 [Neospora caninum Liverpool]|eukprot:XP_003880761.1 conserved hypothetical protein [Neospora caninum Liverpool]
MDRSLLNKLTCSGEEMPAGYLYTELVTSTNNLFAPVGQSAFGANPQFRLGNTASAGVAPQDTVVEILEFVSRKLERSDSDPFVKMKCLRLLKHLCERGHERVRGIIQRRYLHRIKACQTYRGPPHPLQGDAPSAAVRAEADACLRCLYAHENGAAGSAVPTSIEATGRIEGFGPGSRATPGADGGYGMEGVKTSCGTGFGGAYGGTSWSASGSSMVGFGNPHFSHEKQPSRREQALQLISATASKILPTSVQEQLQKVVTTALPGGGGPPVSRLGYSSSGSFRPPTAPQSGDSKDGIWTASTSFSSPYAAAPEEQARIRYGSSAGRYGDSAGGYCRPNLGTTASPALSSAHGPVWGPRGGSGFAGATLDSGRVSPPDGQTSAFSSASKEGVRNRPAVSTLVESGAYENRVVEELLVPCGAKLTPSPATLEDFASKCQALDSRVLGCIIQQKLEDEAIPWISRLRLLCGCAALLRRERQRGGRTLGGLARDVARNAAESADAEALTLAEVLAANCVDTLKRCVDSPQLKRQATEVLRLLGEHEDTDAEVRTGNRVATATSTAESNDDRETASAVDLLDLGDEGPEEIQGPGGRGAEELGGRGGEARDLLDLCGEEATHAHAGNAHSLNGTLHRTPSTSQAAQQGDLLDVLSVDLTSLSLASASSDPPKTLSAARCQGAPSSASPASASSFFSGLVVKDDKQKRREGASSGRGGSSLLSPTCQAGRSSSASLLPETDAGRGDRASWPVASKAPAICPQEMLALDTVLAPLASSVPGGGSRGSPATLASVSAKPGEQPRRVPVPFPLSHTSESSPACGNAASRLGFSPLLLSPVASESIAGVAASSTGTGFAGACGGTGQVAANGLFPASLSPLSAALAAPTPSFSPGSCSPSTLLGAAAGPAFPPPSSGLTPQTRTAHLDRVFNACGASGQTRQAVCGATGYAALFPQGRSAANCAGLTPAASAQPHAPSAAPPGREESSSGTREGGAERGAPFSRMVSLTGASTVQALSSHSSPLGASKGTPDAGAQPAGPGNGGAGESRNPEARTKFAFVTS